MKSTHVPLALALFGALVMVAGVSAETPLIINYQGHLQDNAGIPVDRVLDIVFRIYDSPQNGNVLWQEPQTITVSKGLFSAQLGAAAEFPINPLIFGNGLTYLAVVIDGNEIARERLVASPYAIRSGTSDMADLAQNATLLQGQPPSGFAPADHGHSATDLVGGSLSTDIYDSYQDLLEAGYLDNSGSSDLLTRTQLDGRFSPMTHNHDASAIATGTLSNYRFSAFADLYTEGATDGNDDLDLMNRIQCDLRYAADDHEHTGTEIILSLGDGGYLDNNSSGDLLTRTQLDGRYASASHTHEASQVQCKFHYRVESLSTNSVIADGVIAANGTVVSGGPLNAVTWDATNGRYELTFTISGFTIDSHTVMITPVANQPRFATIGSTSTTHLVVYIWQP